MHRIITGTLTLFLCLSALHCGKEETKDETITFMGITKDGTELTNSFFSAS